jgi:lipopolysaccharide export LptBFGC system permease protein LptF
MLRVQRAIAFELVFVLVASTVVVLSVLFAGRALHLLNRMPGLEIRHLLPLLPSLLPAALGLALPYALAVSAALVYGRMVSDREIVAMRLSGMPLQAIVAPALAVGALVSLGALWLHGGPAPDSEREIRTRQRDLADLFFASLTGPDRGFALKGARVSFDRYAEGRFYGVEIDRRVDDDGRLLQKLIADEATFHRVGDELQIRSPELWGISDSGPEPGAETRVALRPGETSIGRIEDLGGSIAFQDLVKGKRFELKPKDMTVADLLYLVQRGDIPDITSRRSEIELHSRLTAGIAPLVFALLAVGGALQVPAGGRRLLAFLVALTPVFAVNFPLALFGRSLAEANRLPPVAGVWAASAVSLLLALALLRRASAR